MRYVLWGPPEDIAWDMPGTCLQCCENISRIFTYVSCLKLRHKTPMKTHGGHVLAYLGLLTVDSLFSFIGGTLSMFQDIFWSPNIGKDDHGFNCSYWQWWPQHLWTWSMVPGYHWYVWMILDITDMFGNLGKLKDAYVHSVLRDYPQGYLQV